MSVESSCWCGLNHPYDHILQQSEQYDRLHIKGPISQQAMCVTATGHQEVLIM